ncbi:MAG: hypothetical protein JW938_06725, partial [Candidatus Omnitrophica bacterium]|nr:hypothetical protein [Candidatus Omnitrophota bacterium]
MKKNIPGRRSSFTSGILVRILIFVIAWAAIVAVSIYDRELVRPWKTMFREGEPAAKDFYSPYSFTYVNEVETEQKKRYEQDRVRDVYQREIGHLNGVTNELQVIAELLKQPLVEGATFAESIAQAGLKEIDPAVAAEIGDLEMPEDFLTIVKEALVVYANTNLLSLTQKIELFKNGMNSITIADGQSTETYQVAGIMTLNEELSKIERKGEELFPKDRKKRAVFVGIIKGALKPNLVFAPNLTRQIKDQVYAETQPVYDRIV